MSDGGSRRYAWCMPRSEDDAAAAGPAVPSRRILVVAGGFVLAAAATLAVFLTDNPQYLRIAVVAVAWAFVLATLAAGRRGGDRAVAADREAQLRRAYEHELDLEVAARREYELELENQLRRETEQTMREELDALRGELAALAELRHQVAGVAALRSDVAGLSGLREEVARVAAMRDDIVALGSLRHELGQLHELRDDMGRLRAELTEQLSSEMLIERIVMRTQASRLPGEPTRTLEASWGEETPRELTGGWPAVRLDEVRETRQFEQVRVERTDVRPSPATHTAASWTPPAPPPTTVFAGPQPSRLGPPPTAAPSVPDAAPAEPAPRAPATTAFPLLPPSAPVAPPPSPLDWLVARELLDVPEVPAVTEAPSVPEVRPAPPRPAPRRRRSDDAELPPVPVAEARTAEQPEPAGPATSPGSTNRLAEILAENGVSPASGGRRRRRYREDDDGSDDVLARVLGRD